MACWRGTRLAKRSHHCEKDLPKGDIIERSHLPKGDIIERRHLPKGDIIERRRQTRRMLEAVAHLAALTATHDRHR